MQHIFMFFIDLQSDNISRGNWDGRYDLFIQIYLLAIWGALGFVGGAGPNNLGPDGRG